MYNYQPGAYPIIDRLLAALQYFEIRIEVQPLTPDLDDIAFRAMTVYLQDDAFPVIVDDEYGDGADETNQAMLLHLVLRECEYYDDCEDFLVWCKDNELDVASSLASDIFYKIGKIAPRLLETVGPEVRSIPEWDYEMATGVTQQLRAMGRKED